MVKLDSPSLAFARNLDKVIVADGRSQTEIADDLCRHLKTLGAEMQPKTAMNLLSTWRNNDNPARKYNQLYVNAVCAVLGVNRDDLYSDGPTKPIKAVRPAPKSDDPASVNDAMESVRKAMRLITAGDPWFAKSIDLAYAAQFGSSV